MQHSPLQFNSPRYTTTPNSPVLATPDSIHVSGGTVRPQRPRRNPRQHTEHAVRMLRRVLRRCFSPWAALVTRDRAQAKFGVLQRHDDALRSHGAEVEAAFVTVGKALHEQTRLAADLVERGKRFNSFTAETAAANPVRAAIALIDATLRSLDSFRHEIGEVTQQLRQHHDEIATLRKRGAQLERAIAPLRIVDTLFRIESAGLPTEMQNAFSALTQEIARLDLRVRETFRQHFEALGATREAIAAAVQHLSAQRVENERIAAAQNVAMRQSLAGLEEEIAWLRERDERAADIVGQVDRETNAIVVGLQYQDITRQKLEHVTSAIGALAKRGAEKPDRRAFAFVEHAARLEASQLAAIEEELRLAIETIAAGSRAVVDRLEELEGGGFGANDCDAVAAKIHATVAVLLDMLKQLRVPMEQAVANAQATAQAMHSFGGVTADLGETIRELTWGIRLIALNAQVQAAQVQRCDGLEVLARHTYLVSEETSQYGETLGRDLGSLAERLGDAVRRAKSFGAETAAARAALESEAARITATLTAQRDSAVDALHEFPPLFGEIRDHANRLVRGAALASIDRAPLRQAQADLRELGDWCAKRAAGVPHRAVRDELASWQRKYTMASERAIHAAVVNGYETDSEIASKVEAPSDSAPTAAPVRNSAGLGDNVELF